MDILVYGAGVLGSLYAARLKQAGQNVTILARGRRFREIRHHSIILEDERTERRTCTRVRVVSELRPDDAYDLVLVVLRKDQVHGVLAPLAANHRTPTVLFMVNNAAGPGDYVSALGADRVLLGFPGAGGARIGNVVRYGGLGRTQPTTVGELDGRVTGRLWEIVGLLELAGFPTVISRHMDAWLKTHVAVVSPIANALYYAGDNYRLAQNREGLQLLVRAIREGFQVLRALRVPITPLKYRLFIALPSPLLVLLFRGIMGSRRAALVMMRHARVAVPEMKLLADEFMQLVRQTAVPTPALDRLYQVVQDTARLVTVVGRGV